MMCDLFSAFDYGRGTNFFLGSVYLWASGFFIPFFLTNYGLYWYKMSAWESLLMNFMEEYVKKVPEEVKVFAGAPHLLFSLLVTMLCMNLSSYSPFFYPLSSHYYFVMMWAVPFWFATLMLSFNVNWRLIFMTRVYFGANFIAGLMIVVAEVMGVFVRPITLTCRLCTNCIVAKTISHGFQVMVGTFLYPFAWQKFFVMNKSFFLLFVFLFKKFMLLGLLFFLFFAECLMGTVQAFIFVGLLIFYIYEVPIKVSACSRQKVYGKFGVKWSYTGMEG